MRRCGVFRQVCGGVGACVAMCALMMSPTVSATAGEKKPLTWRDVWKWREVWSGADVSRKEWLVYSGITVAPFGHIHEDGWRLRLAGGYGGYKYSGDRSVTPDVEDIKHFKAQTYFTDVLAGYLIKWGPLTAKAFGGVSLIDHQLSEIDDEAIVDSNEVGAKGVIELWLNISSNAFASLDLAWSTAHDTRSARSRIGYRLWSNFSMGLEAGLNLDAQSNCKMEWGDKDDCKINLNSDGGHRDILDYSRGGAFMRYEWDGGEISASAGVAGGIVGNSDSDGPDPYVTINYITQW